MIMNLINKDEIAKKIELSKYTVNKYVSAKVFVSHKKDKRDGRTSLFYEPCVDVLDAFRIQMMENDKSKKEIGKKFREVFGDRDEDLIRRLSRKDSSVKAVIEHYQSSFS